MKENNIGFFHTRQPTTCTQFSSCLLCCNVVLVAVVNCNVRRQRHRFQYFDCRAYFLCRHIVGGLMFESMMIIILDTVEALLAA